MWPPNETQGTQRGLVVLSGALGLPPLSAGDTSLHSFSTEYRIIPEQWADRCKKGVERVRERVYYKNRWRGGGTCVDRNRGMRVVHNLSDCLARLTGQGEYKIIKGWYRRISFSRDGYIVYKCTIVCLVCNNNGNRIVWESDKGRHVSSTGMR